VVEETGAILMVGFKRRFDPDFRALKEAIDAGRIGAVEMITLTSRDPGPPPLDYIKRSGGIFRDMTIHDFDVARWLLGEEVETVQAAASVLTDPEIGKAGDYDSVNVILTTASGRHCTITNTRRATYGYDQRIEVHGAKGSVVGREPPPIPRPHRERVRLHPAAASRLLHDALRRGLCRRDRGLRRCGRKRDTAADHRHATGSWRLRWPMRRFCPCARAVDEVLGR
jgi:predicted dehydrogenase